MTSYSIRIEMPKGKVKQIMDRLNKAQEEIYECYSELEVLGILTVIPEKEPTQS